MPVWDSSGESRFNQNNQTATFNYVHNTPNTQGNDHNGHIANINFIGTYVRTSISKPTLTVAR
jgi:hypothetical protein